MLCFIYMKSIRVLLPFCTLMLAIGGCAHPQGSPALIPVSAQRMFRLPYEKVWNAAMAVLTEDLKLPLDEVVPQKGMVSTKWVTYKSRAGDYKEANRRKEIGTRGSPMLVKYRLVVLVKDSPDGTMLQARRYKQEFKKRWTPAPTDLVFERQFLSLVAARLGVIGP